MNKIATRCITLTGLLLSSQCMAFSETGAHYGVQDNNLGGETRISDYYLKHHFSSVNIENVPLNEASFLDPHSAVHIGYSKNLNRQNNDQESGKKYGFTFVNNSGKIVLDFEGTLSKYVDSNISSSSKNYELSLGLLIGKGKLLKIGRELRFFNEVSPYEEETEQSVSYRQWTPYFANSSFAIGAYYSDTNLSLNSGTDTKLMTTVGISTDFYFTPNIGLHINALDYDGDDYYQDGDILEFGGSIFIGNGIKLHLKHFQSSGTNIRNQSGSGTTFGISIRPDFF